MKNVRRIALTAMAVGLLAAGAAAQGHKGHEETPSPGGLPPPKVETLLIMKEQILPLKVTVTGEVVDVACFLRHDARGKAHLDCANYCATEGMPLGIFDARNNQVYLIIPQGHYNPAEAMAKYVTKTVRATGLGYSWGGLKGIEVRQVEEVKDQAEKR